jgi:hypothetical protein
MHPGIKEFVYGVARAFQLDQWIAVPASLFRGQTFKSGNHSMEYLNSFFEFVLQIWIIRILSYLKIKE